MKKLFANQKFTYRKKHPHQYLYVVMKTVIAGTNCLYVLAQGNSDNLSIQVFHFN